MRALPLLPPSKFKIISINNEDIGAYLINKYSDYFNLDMLLIVKRYQNKGIGRQIVEKIKLLASKENKSLKLSVIKTNPASNFYKHMGFQVAGEKEGSIKFEYAS